ncbi:hypothetical protein, partial [uncultured Alcanivorax sp.]|uniref:hypothetical protein n=1 Tax=uncultured Alcanivorax sp. TaxID=191215 RepID=UPI002611BB83
MEMSPLFGSTKYLKVHPIIARLLNVAEYMYYFEDINGVVRTADRTQEFPDLFLSPVELAVLAFVPTANNMFRRQSAILNVGLEDMLYESRPVTLLDTR